MKWNVQRAGSKFRDYSGVSTIHGISNCGNAKTRCFRWFWICVSIACVCIMIWQVSLLILKYLKFEKQTNIAVLQDFPTFPAVTICQLNPYKKSALDAFLNENESEEENSMETNATSTETSAATTATEGNRIVKRRKRQAESSVCGLSAGGTSLGCLGTNRRYEFTAGSMTWNAAFDVCSSRGGKLAHLETINFLTALKSKLAELSLNPSHSWIGAKAMSVNLADWIWVDEKNATTGMAIIGHIPTMSSVTSGISSQPSVALHSHIAPVPQFTNAYSGDSFFCEYAISNTTTTTSTSSTSTTTSTTSTSTTSATTSATTTTTSTTSTSATTSTTSTTTTTTTTSTSTSTTTTTSITTSTTTTSTTATTTTTTTTSATTTTTTSATTTSAPDAILEQSIKQENTLKEATGLSEAKRETATVTVREAIRNCIFNREACSVETDFTSTLDYKFGKCYTYNEHGVFNSTRSGQLFGLKIEMFSDTSDYLDTTNTAGVRLVIHDHHIWPFPDAFGFNVPIGTAASFSVKTRSYERIGAPHGNCSNSPPKTFYKGDYTVEACLRTCLQNETIQMCNCSDYRLNVSANFNQTPICNVTDSCQNKLTGANCFCPVPCRETYYEAVASSTKWPFNKDDAVNSSTKCGTQECGIMLEVFMEQLTNQVLLESPRYSAVDLLSDVGGQVGFWLGMSAISMLEVTVVLSQAMAVMLNRKPGRNIAPIYDHPGHDIPSIMIK